MSVYSRVHSFLAANEDTEPQGREGAMLIWRYRHFSTELLDDLSWLVRAVHWRIYKALPTPVHSNLAWGFFETLQDLGISALESDLDRVALDAVSHLSELVVATLEKPLNSVYGSSRAAVHIAKVGMAALQRQDEKVVAVSITELRKLWAMFQAKYADNEELAMNLLRELEGVQEEVERYRPVLDEVEIHFMQSVTPQIVTDYLARVHKALGVE
jgi:hypothetical protein